MALRHWRTEELRPLARWNHGSVGGSGWCLCDEGLRICSLHGNSLLWFPYPYPYPLLCHENKMTSNKGKLILFLRLLSRSWCEQWWTRMMPQQWQPLKMSCQWRACRQPTEGVWWCCGGGIGFMIWLVEGWGGAGTITIMAISSAKRISSNVREHKEKW